ncbi:MAG: hypothetical protein H6Q20_2239 [Bacteroidetes bacterium]|nr:hypothetical protein [Bacteroidota bacterium]MBP1677680.1 hypothetical protein [Bacteroidota bacterium]
MKRFFTILVLVSMFTFVCVTLHAQVSLQNPTIKDSGYDLQVILALTDKNGNSLDQSKLSFYVFKDNSDAPVTFDKEIYTKLDSSITEIPYGFADKENYDFYQNSDGATCVYYAWSGHKKLGAQAIHRDGDIVSKSDIVWTDGTITSADGGTVDPDPDPNQDPTFDESALIINPEGTKTETSRSSFTYYKLGSGIYSGTDNGLISNYVNGTDGNIYLQGTIGKFKIDNYIKLEKIGDKYKAAFPQLILVQEQDGVKYPFYASRLVKTTDQDNDSTYYAIDTANANELTFSLSETGVLTLDGSSDGNVILGLIDADSIWTGYGDYDFSETPINSLVTTLPEGAEIKTWILSYKFANDPEGVTSTKKVSVAMVGNDIFVSNPYNNSKEQWFKGTINGTIATFLPNQFLGADVTSNHYLYFRTGRMTTTDGLTFLYEQANQIIFNYNADVQSLTTTDDVTFFISQGTGTTAANVGNYDFPQFKIFVETVATLQDPAITGISDESSYDDYGYGYIQVKIPTKDTEGNDLDTDNLYYSIYKQGESTPFVLTPAVYVDLTADMTEIPFNLENYDIYPYDADNRTVILYFPTNIKLGVQSIYRTAAGKEYKSNIVWSDGTTGITGIPSVNVENSTDVRYYDLTGRQVLHPQVGQIYIKKTGTSGKGILIKIVK